MSTLSTEALCSTALAKSLLSFTVAYTGDDNVLIDLINSTTRWLEKYCDRKFSKQTFSNGRYSGDGTEKLWLSQYPIVSITSIYDDTNRPPVWGSDTLIDSGDYEIISKYPGLVLFHDDYPSIGVLNLKVTYLAGYDRGTAIGATDDTLPLDLQYAAARLVAKIFKDVTGGRDGVKSRNTAGGGSATFSSEIAVALINMPPDIKKNIDSYKRPEC